MMNNMAFTALACALLTLGCNREEDWNRDIEEIAHVAVDSVRIPTDTIALGSGVSINTYSRLQRGCESFYKFDYSSDGSFVREISAYKLTNKSTCGNPGVVATDFAFFPKTRGIYTLKFRSKDGWITKPLVVN